MPTVHTCRFLHTVQTVHTVQTLHTVHTVYNKGNCESTMRQTRKPVYAAGWRAKEPSA